jgi:two-component system, OmpR family, response regulator
LSSTEASVAPRVVIVDDEEEIRDMVSAYFTRQGIETHAAATEAELDSLVRENAIDTVLLDVNLGREDGFAIARRLRTHWNGGLLMLTGRADTVDRVVGLEIGADDYVTKPFDLRELLARVRSVSRRYRQTPASPTGKQAPKCNAILFDGFRLDPDRRELLGKDGRPIDLTTGEFDLLHVLAQHPGRVRNRDQLLQQTHNRDAGPFDRTIDVQIGRLRKKLGDDGKAPKLIKAVRGVGYVFTPTTQS